MDVYVKQTNELSEKEKIELFRLFYDVFEKERSIEEFNNQFSNNCLGYSFHCLLKEEQKIIGSSSYIPCLYLVNHTKYLFVVSVDTMIRKEYRGLENFYGMATTSYKYLKRQNVDFVYGFPNNIAFPIWTKTKLMSYIGKLNTFCLPYRMGGINKKLRIINWSSMILSQVYSSFSYILSNNKTACFPIEKDAISYNASRYKRMDGNYSIINQKNLWFSYKIKVHEGIRTAFLIDVLPKTSKNFNRSVKYILKNEKSKFDLLLYVGQLPFNNTGMVKVPYKYEPKHFNFTGRILNEEYLSKEILYSINKWDLNLSNFDLI